MKGIRKISDKKGYDSNSVQGNGVWKKQAGNGGKGRTLGEEGVPSTTMKAGDADETLAQRGPKVTKIFKDSVCSDSEREMAKEEEDDSNKHAVGGGETDPKGESMEQATPQTTVRNVPFDKGDEGESPTSLPLSGMPMPMARKDHGDITEPLSPTTMTSPSDEMRMPPPIAS